MKNIRSFQEDELFTMWLGLVIIVLYPADYVRVSISWPIELVIHLVHHFEQHLT